MDTLPTEILGRYVTDYHDCVALRRTCKWYRNFTVDCIVHIEDMSGRPVDENHHYLCSNVYIIWDRRRVYILNTKGMWHYLVMSSCAGAEYTMWLCCQKTVAVGKEIKRLADAKYTYYIAQGARTAVYVKTAELVERPFTPLDGYNDMIWYTTPDFYIYCGAVNDLSIDTKPVIAATRPGNTAYTPVFSSSFMLRSW